MLWTRSRNAWPVAIVADVLVVLVFAAVGRANHHEPTTAHGVWHTAWPFLLGTAVALGLCAYARSDPRGLRAGVRVWIWTVVLGMVARAALGEGVALPFVIVAVLVLGALFLGWRAALTWQTWRSRLHLGRR